MKYRMYCLAERHLSPIQKAIQSAHVILEYGLSNNTCEYRQWVVNDKTIIILDGGSSPDMLSDISVLKDGNIPYAEFHEPDMDGFRTAICFLADERVYDYDHYGRDYNHYRVLYGNDPTLPELTYDEWTEYVGGFNNVLLKCIIANKKLAI